MNVSTFINKLPDSICQDIHKQWRLALGDSSSLLNQELEYLLSTLEGLQAILLTLRDTERVTLRLITACFASEPFDDIKLWKQGRMQLPGAALKVGLMRLCRKGIVFAFRKSWGEQLFRLPADTYKIWQKLLFRECFDLIVEIDAEEVNSLSFERPLPSARLLSLLSFCEREGLPVTKSGQLNKRTLLKLNRVLRIDELETWSPDFPFTMEDTFPFPLAFILDGGMRLELLDRHKYGFVLNKQKLEGWWLSLSEQAMNQALYAHIAQLLKPNHVGLRHWIAISEEIASGMWFSVDEVANRVNTYMGMGKEHVEQRQLISEWLEPLSALGYLELGHDRRGQLVVRNSFTLSSFKVDHVAPPHQTESLFVQPDFEIIVPPGVPYLVLWELEYVSAQEQGGIVSRYRLSKERVQQSLKAGRIGEEMIVFLRKHSKFGLPEIVEYSLRQWIDQWGIHGNGNSEPLGLDSTVVPFSKSDGPQKQLNVSEGMQGLIYSRESVQYYDIERSIPRTEDLYPGLAEIPNIWLREFRSYHEATRMDMIRKALEWKACIRIQQAGRDRLLVPEHIEGTSDNWLISGYHSTGEVILESNQWDKMQLVLPGINDES